MKKRIITFLSLFTTLYAASQVSYEYGNPCCPNKIVVTLDSAAIANFYTSSVEIIVPPVQGAGPMCKQVRFPYPPMVQCYSDAVTPFVTNSNCKIVVQNSSALATLSEFDYTAIINNTTSAGDLKKYVATNTDIYEGTVFMQSTHPITNIGPNAKMVFTFWYFLEEY